MHRLLDIALVLILGGLALSWIVGRFSRTLGTNISLVAGLVGRVAVVVVTTAVAIHAANRGGWFIALVVVCALAAAGAVFGSVVTLAGLWMSMTGRVSD